MLRFWRVRRFLRHLLAESLYLRLKPQIGLFLLGEFSWHRQAGAGTCWQLFDGGRSILLDHASPCHVSAPTPHQNLDRRTIRKRIKRAIDRLREAEKDLP